MDKQTQEIIEFIRQLVATPSQSYIVHAPNEWISVDTIPKIFEIYKRSLIEFSKN